MWFLLIFIWTGAGFQSVTVEGFKNLHACQDAAVEIFTVYHDPANLLNTGRAVDTFCYQKK